MRRVGDRTATFRPTSDRAYEIVGSDSDRGVLLSIVDHDGVYASSIVSFLSSHLQRDAVVADIGANIGVVTVVAADLAPDGRVYAFEPAPENLAYLRRNVARAPNVEIVEAAVAEVDGELRFASNPAYPAGAHLDRAGELRVDAVALDSWADQRDLGRLDAVKVDVEGAEPLVLRGAARTISRLRPVVVLECNPASLRRVSGVGFADLLVQLEELFPNVAILGDGGTTIPLAGADHLELALGRDGVVDLVGMWSKPSVAAKVRARRHLARLRSLGRRSPPEPHTFAVTAPVRLVVEPSPASAPAGGQAKLRVGVENASRWWLSPDFAYHPINVGARWVGGAEAGRARFASPVAPGAAATVDLDVDLPAVPGRHRLEITLVQEAYAWIGDLDPRCRVEVDVDVEVR